MKFKYTATKLSLSTLDNIEFSKQPELVEHIRKTYPDTVFTVQDSPVGLNSKGETIAMRTLKSHVNMKPHFMVLDPTTFKPTEPEDALPTIMSVVDEMVSDSQGDEIALYMILFAGPSVTVEGKVEITILVRGHWDRQ